MSIYAMLIGDGFFDRPAQAGFVVDLTQVGSNVVAKRGALDLTKV